MHLKFIIRCINCSLWNKSKVGIATSTRSVFPTRFNSCRVDEFTLIVLVSYTEQYLVAVDLAIHGVALHDATCL